jgi:DNA-binding MarR family transcriptional regulator
MKKDTSLDLLNAADELGYEARTAKDDHAALKLWLRLLSSTHQIEAEIRRRLRVQFDTSLPRFDYLAQLYRAPEGLRMKELSSHLMVTGANVTGLTDELERDGWVARASSPTDRRSWIVHLTPTGRAQFETMAQAHEQWILELFACLGSPALAQMYQQLGHLRVHVMEKQASSLSGTSGTAS